jgi:hypothetical protein
MFYIGGKHLSGPKEDSWRGTLSCVAFPCSRHVPME